MTTINDPIYSIRLCAGEHGFRFRLVLWNYANDSAHEIYETNSMDQIEDMLNRWVDKYL